MKAGTLGTMLHVGGDCNYQKTLPTKVIPLTVLFTNDSEAAYKLCGLPRHGGKRSCRFCQKEKLYCDINLNSVSKEHIFHRRDGMDQDLKWLSVEGRIND